MVHWVIQPGARRQCVIWDEGELHDGFLSAGGQMATGKAEVKPGAQVVVTSGGGSEDETRSGDLQACLW